MKKYIKIQKDYGIDAIYINKDKICNIEQITRYNGGEDSPLDHKPIPCLRFNLMLNSSTNNNSILKCFKNNESSFLKSIIEEE